jgi:HEPN domain-containing protein
MLRTDLQKLSQAKLDDALLLCQAGRYSNAYYLAGYSVELGLKACASRQIVEHQIPDKAFVNGIMTHDFPRLVNLAGLKSILDHAQDEDRVFSANWALTAEWSPDARYVMTDATSTEMLLKAVGDPDHGVLKWIKMHW